MTVTNAIANKVTVKLVTFIPPHLIFMICIIRFLDVGPHISQAEAFIKFDIIQYEIR